MNGRSESSRRKDLEELIPGLISSDYELTSDASGDYNCIAWAAGDTSKRWDDEDEDLYWPAQAVLRDGTLASLMEAFGALGYEISDHGDVEEGFEKVALYATEGRWHHAAKQLPDGRWSSKCGKLDDIAHGKLSDVYCPEYGEVACFMKRRTAETTAAESQ